MIKYDKKVKRIFNITVVSLLILMLGLEIWTSSAESAARWTPDYSRVDLMPILMKQERDEQDYRILLQQTGLHQHTVDELITDHQTDTIVRLQDYFFASPSIRCKKNSPISREEFVVDEDGYKAFATEIVPLEAGDILLTLCSHTFGWRNGHAAIVVDGDKGITLESVVLGQDSCTQPVSKWQKYASFMVFRLKDASQEERAAIAETALEKLNGIPYGFSMGLWTPKHPEDKVELTHCAHLVWEAFLQFGYDLDSDGGRIVTPKDIANSPLLELRQVYGMDPQELWS